MSGAAAGEETVRSAVPVPDLSALNAALAESAEALKVAVRNFRPADVGRELARRSTEDGKKLLEAMDDRHAAKMIRAAHPAVAGQVIAACDPAQMARVLQFVPLDHQVKILAELTPELRTELEKALDPEDAAATRRLLAYPEVAVARLMTTRVWTCGLDATVGDALAILREHDEAIEVAPNCYVVDNGRLVGVAPLRELAVFDPNRRMADVMTRAPIAVSEETERGDAAEIIQTHNFLSLPVIDKDGKLVGAVSVDDLLTAALSAVGTGFLNQGGVTAGAAALPYFRTSLWRVVRSRLTWLVLLFVAETLTGTVLRYFEDELARVVALSFFVPLLIGTGGNAGSQTVSTVIRALALGEIRKRDVLRVAGKEVLTGLCLGVLLGSIAFGRSLLWGVGSDLAICVAVTVCVVCTWANAVGALIPITAEALGIDPTVVSAPLITTLVDASGLFIYFSVAHLTISALHDEKPAEPPPVQLATFDPLLGDWTCAGTRDGHAVRGSLALAREPDEHVIQVSWRGDASAVYATPIRDDEIWTFNGGAYVRLLADNHGRSERATSQGFRASMLSWSNGDTLARASADKKLTFAGSAGNLDCSR